MCTVIIATGCSPRWPMLLAANRDEKLDRPALPPARHWPSQPDVIGGLDVLAGGTWLALNRAGVVACVLNRPGTLGPAAGKRSRGVLPLLALEYPTASDAIQNLAEQDGRNWQSFNVVVADRANAYFIRGTSEHLLHVMPLPQGIHMVTAQDPNDTDSPRIARHLPLFRQAALPKPPEWGVWQRLLADARPPRDAALNVPPVAGFGTVSSALIAIGAGQSLHYLASDGMPMLEEFKEAVLF